MSLKNKIILSVCYALLTVAAASAGSEYFSVTGPCNIQFPKDHGSHPGYKTEWWYYTGNLTSSEGKDCGFQLTFFRRQISPPGSETSWAEFPSAWRTKQIFMAHAGLSDLSEKNYYHSEQISREALGMAGAKEKNGGIRVFLKNWNCLIQPSTHRLHAETDDFSFSLALTPLKPYVLHGNDGYSQKGRKQESASCYYSFTRLASSGTLNVKGKSYAVSGFSWMDHEFSSAPLEPDIQGWDWFCLQLSDNTELMLYLLRKKDSASNAVAGGTFIFPDGKTLDLSEDSFETEILDTWKSRETGAVYPSEWRIAVRPVSLDLLVFSNLENQEMHSPQSTGVSYWEGSVSAEGSAKGKSVKGKGYAELTGYDKKFDAF